MTGLKNTTFHSDVNNIDKDGMFQAHASSPISFCSSGGLKAFQFQICVRADTSAQTRPSRHVRADTPRCYTSYLTDSPLQLVLK